MRWLMRLHQISLKFVYNTSFAVVLVSTLLISGQATAATEAKDAKDANEAVRKLSWKEALALATERNPQLRASRESVRAAELRLKASHWLLAPSLSADLSWLHQNRVGLDLPESDSTALNLKQSIFDGANYGSIDDAKATRGLNESVLLSQRAAVSRDLMIALATALTASRSLKLTQSIIERRKLNYELVQLRFESGRENGGAVELSKANLADAGFGLVQAQNDADVANTQVAALLDLSFGEKIEITGDVPTTKSAAIYDYKSLADRAPERIQALATEEKARASVMTAKGRILPTVNLVGGVGRYGDHFLPQTEGWSVGVTLSIPLFAGSSYYGVQAARADALAAEYQRRVTETSLVPRVQQAHVTYAESEQREKLAQIFVNATRTRAEVARQKYQTGLTSFDEWDRIESDLIGRETAALQAVLTRVTAEANWQYILGEGSL